MIGTKIVENEWFRPKSKKFQKLKLLFQIDRNMGHENIWFSHKGKNTSGKGLRHCRVQGGRAVGLIKKYGLNMSRQAFRENAALIGFKKLD